MHDTDLVETLETLGPDEQNRFFIYLEHSSDPTQKKYAHETRSVTQYIFQACNSLNRSLAPAHVWQTIHPNIPFEESLWNRWLRDCLVISIEAIKKRLNKRIATDEKNLRHLLQRLSPEERYLILDHIKQRQDTASIQKLLQHFIVVIETFESSLTMKAICKLLKLDEDGAEPAMAKVRSRVLKTTRQFIAREAKNGLFTELSEWYWLQLFFYEKQSTKLYRQARTHFQKQFQTVTEKSIYDHYLNFSTENLEHEFLSSINDTNGDQNLWETIRSLDEYYLIMRLKLICQLLNINQLTPLALPPKETWWYFNLNDANLQWFFHQPLGRLFRGAIQLLTEETEVGLDDFLQFIALLRRSETIIPKELVADFEVYAINHGIRKMNRGFLDFGHPVLSLEQHRVSAGQIFKEQKILSREYQGIATLALFLKEYDWTLHFIEQYKHLVSGVMPSLEYYYYCLALYQYRTGQKLEALQILMNHDFDDLACKMAARILEVKVLCELDLSKETKLRVSDQLDARIEAGILFFFRLKEVSPHTRTMQKRFMDFMKKIIRARENQRWNLLEKIKKEVMTIDMIAERTWLLGTIDQYLAQQKSK